MLLGTEHVFATVQRGEEPQPILVTEKLSLLALWVGSQAAACVATMSIKQFLPLIWPRLLFRGTLALVCVVGTKWCQQTTPNWSRLQLHMLVGHPCRVLPVS